MGQHKDNRYHDIKRVFEDHHKKIIDDFYRKHGPILKKVSAKGLSLAGTAILVSSLLAGSPSQITHPKSSTKHESLTESQSSTKVKSILYKTKGQLSPFEEDEIADTLSDRFNLNLKANLEGHKLNEIYGYTGAEQHLYRWPGDSLAKHNLQQAGIAPLKGAFGYFDNAEQEEYYIAVQLHELPTWDKDWPTLKPWYRFRKVFVYNPDNGKGAVAVIGDSGPSKWTGKTFGCSPELMQYMERVDGSQKGKIVVLFVDDPQNKIALGPSRIDDLALKTN